MPGYSLVNDSRLLYLSRSVFYIVYLYTLQDLDGCAFQYALDDNWTTNGRGRFRHQFFFFPSATTQKCVAH